jgi:hypothetical protein
VASSDPSSITIIVRCKPLSESFPVTERMPTTVRSIEAISLKAGIITAMLVGNRSDGFAEASLICSPKSIRTRKKSLGHAMPRWWTPYT